MTNQNFFHELTREGSGGVAYKNLYLKKKTIAYFANNGHATIGDLCKELNSSAPKVTTLLTDLINDGFVQDYGKVDSTGGRRPNLYGLRPESGFFVGVEVKRNHVNIGLLDLQKTLIEHAEYIPYELSNTPASLDDLCNIINDFVQGFPELKDKILGCGVNLPGRINFATGYSYSFFYFNEEPLSKTIGSRIGIPTFLENDSRAMAYGEFSSGVVNEEKDVLFVNLDHGIGLGILINGQLYYGKSGFAGEFGHTPFFDNGIVCHCGKKGCLETEASGQALIRLFREKTTAGATSALSGDVHLDDIVRAATDDDSLAIELLAEIGEKLGRGIALLINLFNPELVILGGSISAAGDYIRLPIKSAIYKYSLSLVNNDSQLKISKLGEQAGMMGACLLVRNKLLNF